MAHRKSEKEHQKQGTYRKDRHANQVDTSGNLTELPAPPIALNESAAKIYTDEGNNLVSMGLLRSENTRLLATYAMEMATYIEQMEAAQSEGIVIELPNGISTSSAHRKAAESALKNATAIGDRLGLSPIGRSRLGIRVEGRAQGGGPSILDLIKQPRKGNAADPLAHFLEN